MKITKYYSPDPAEGGGEAAEEKQSAFSALKSDFIADEMGEDPNDKKEPVVEEKKEETPGDKLELEDDKPGEKKEEKSEEKKDEKKEEKKPEEKPGDKKEEKKDEKKPEEKEPVLTLEDEGENKEVEIDAWDKLAETEGLKIDKNDYQTYIKAHDEKVKADLVKEYETKIAQANQLSIDKVLENVKDPKTRLLIEMAQIEGMTFDKIAQPLTDIQKAKDLPDIDLVRKDRELKGWKPDRIDREIERLTESDGIKDAADDVRLELDDIETEIQTSYNNRLAKHKELIESQKQRERQADHEAMEKVFSKTDKFMDLTMPKATVEKIVAKYKAGEYDNLWKDPEFKSKAILQHVFGEKAKSLLKTNSFADGRATKTKALHNVPIEDGAKKVTDVNQSGAKKGAFSAIKEDM